jgi:hypothetical protein
VTECRGDSAAFSAYHPLAANIEFENAKYPRNVRTALTVLSRDRSSVRADLSSRLLPSALGVLYQLDLDSRSFAYSAPDRFSMIRPSYMQTPGLRFSSAESGTFNRDSSAGHLDGLVRQFTATATWDTSDERRRLGPETDLSDQMYPWEDQIYAVELSVLNADARGPTGFFSVRLEEEGGEDWPVFDGMATVGLDGLVTLAIARIQLEAVEGQILATVMNASVQIHAPSDAGFTDLDTFSVSVQRAYDVTTRTLEFGGVGASVVADPGSPLSVSYFEPHEVHGLRDFFRSLGRSLPQSWSDGVVELDTSALEAALMARVEVVIDDLVASMVEGVQMPERTIDEDLAAFGSQAEGTGFRYVVPFDGTENAARLVGDSIVVGGAFTRVGIRCSTHGDCACTPDEDPGCTRVGMFCNEIEWCE